jgi:hypothetical protein
MSGTVELLIDAEEEQYLRAVPIDATRNHTSCLAAFAERVRPGAVSRAERPS